MDRETAPVRGSAGAVNRTGQSKAFLGQIVEAFFWNASLLPLASLISFALSILIARELQLAQYPAFAVLVSFKDSVLLFGDFGLGQGLSRFIPMATHQGGRAAAVRLVVQALAVRLGVFCPVAAILVLTADTVARHLQLAPGAETAGVRWVALLALLEALAVTLSYVMWSLLEQKWVNLVNLLDVVLQPILVVGAIRAGWGLEGILAGFTVSTAVRVALLLVCSWRALARLGPPEAECEEPVAFLRVMRLGFASFADKLLRYFLSPPFLVLLLNRSLPRAEVAVFALGLDLVFKVAATASSGAQGWVVPLLATAHDRKDRGQMQLAYAGTVQLLSALLLPAGFLFLSLAGALVPLLYRPEFARAGVLVVYLGPALLLEFAISAPAVATCFVAERVRFYLASVACAAALCSLAGASAGALGLEGFCLLFGAIRLANAAVLTIWALRMHGLSFPLAFFAKLLAVSALVAWMVSQGPTNWSSLIVRAAAGGLALLAAIRLVRPLNAQERSMMRGSGLRGASLIARFL